jgi:hypothetical protein
VKAWTRAPIRSACWRLHLIGGVERTFFWSIVLSSLLACGAAWFADLSYLLPFIVIGAISALELCRRATIEDPMATKVWLRWIFEEREVTAVGRCDQPSKGSRRRR